MIESIVAIAQSEIKMLNLLCIWSYDTTALGHVIQKVDASKYESID